MGEHRRVDRQAVLHNRDQTTNSQSLSALPQVEDGISIGGSWYPVFRPLAKDYGVPGRGVEGHGSDSDSKVADYLPDQSGAVAPLRDDVGDNAPDYTDLMLDADPYTPGVQTPVLVSVVPSPKLAVTKEVRTVTLFDGIRTVYSYASGPLPGIDLTNVVSLPADPARVRVSLQLSRTYSPAASQSLLYFYAMSYDPMFTDYVTISPAASGAAQLSVTALVVENCTSALYFTIIPWAVFDPTKTNVSPLVALVERSTVANANPAV